MSRTPDPDDDDDAHGTSRPIATASRMRKKSGKSGFGYKPTVRKMPWPPGRAGGSVSHGQRQLLAARQGPASPMSSFQILRRAGDGERRKSSPMKRKFEPPAYSTAPAPTRKPLDVVPVRARARQQGSIRDFLTRSTHRAPRHSLEGFRNLGNTCYMNAVMQSLMQLQPFASELLAAKLDTRSSGMVALPELRADSYLRAVVELAARLRHRSSQVIALRDVKDKLEAYSSQFRGSAQQDAQEFLLETLFHLHTDHALATRQRVLGVPADRAWALGDCRDVEDMWRVIANETSAVRRNFSCHIEHTFKCAGCGEEGAKVETYRDLSLDLTPPDGESDSDGAADDGAASTHVPTRPAVTASGPTGGTRTPSVYDMLPSDSPPPPPPPPSSPPRVPLRTLVQRFFTPATVERTCETCAHPTAVRHSRILQLPRVFVITLKRFKPNFVTKSMDKVCTPVRVPRVLSLQTLCTERTRDPPPFDTRVPPTPRPMEQSPPRSVKRARTAGPALQQATLSDVVVIDREPSSYERDLERALAQSRELAEAAPANEDDALKRAIEMSLREAEEAKAAQEALACKDAAAADAADEESAVGMVEFATFLEHVDTEHYKHAAPTPCTPRYALHSIVSHIGDDVSSGHYVCDVRHAAKEWKRYNDSVVHSVTDREVRGGTARRNGYMFFFVHSGSAPPALRPPRPLE